MLKVIESVGQMQPVSLIPTCLAAHTRPREFTNNSEYLRFLIEKLLPAVKNETRCRASISVDPTAFSVEESRMYLTQARQFGFTIVLHADQFGRGGSLLAAELNALSADHLEASTDEDFKALAVKDVVATVLPGASLGLGLPQLRTPDARHWTYGRHSIRLESGIRSHGQSVGPSCNPRRCKKLSLAETFPASLHELQRR